MLCAAKPVQSSGFRFSKNLERSLKLLSACA
jgi:hypothetical protein